MKKAIKVGEFEVVSGKVRISDPCYKLDTWCAGTINKVKKGTWIANVIKGDEDRCATLIAYHKDYPVLSDFTKFAPEAFEVGVDSGQAGIFDIKYFKDDKIVEGVKKMRSKDKQICEDEPWYSLCCDRTLDGDGAGVIPFGCVSSTGYGDGSYDCFTIETKGVVTAIKIEFMNEDGEEEIEEDIEDEVDEDGLDDDDNSYRR